MSDVAPGYGVSFAGSDKIWIVDTVGPTTWVHEQGNPENKSFFTTNDLAIVTMLQDQNTKAVDETIPAPVPPVETAPVVAPVENSSDVQPPLGKNPVVAFVENEAQDLAARVEAETRKIIEGLAAPDPAAPPAEKPAEDPPVG